MGRKLFTTIAAIATVWAVVAAPAAPASAAKGGARSPVVFRGALHRLASGISSVAATDRFVYFERRIVKRSRAGTPISTWITRVLLDQKTGKRKAISPPSCGSWGPGSTVFGGPYLMLDCGQAGAPAPVLYDLAHERWTRVTIDPLLAQSCETLPVTCGAIAVGSRWIALLMVEIHGVITYELEPVGGGPAVVNEHVRAGGRMTFDLDARSGDRPLCQPLTYPDFGNDLVGSQPGWLQTFGRFALAGPAGSTATYLQGCGSRTRVWIDGPVAASAQIVAWVSIENNRFQLSGAWLPSLRRFSVPLPAGFSAPGGSPTVSIAVSRRTIYVLDGASVLWKAVIPARPPA